MAGMKAVMAVMLMATLPAAKATAQPGDESVNNSAVTSSSLQCYLKPGFLTVASICVLFALSTLVLSVLQCKRCASARNGHEQGASSSDSMTFKSSEHLVSQPAYSPYNNSGRGSLHTSENSLYGVI